MSDTGGGHRASAQALKAGFEQLYGSKYQVDMVDMWTEHTIWPWNKLSRSYSFMVNNAFVWRFSYYGSQPRLAHRTFMASAGALVARHMSRAFDEYQPDLVVSVHPLMQHVPLRVLQQRVKRGLSKPTPFATVVTDLTTCHNTWFHTGVTRCFVATEYARQRALKLGLKPEQVTLHGLPIRPDFNRKMPPKARLRQQLGMDRSKPAVLLVGGGEGFGPVEATCSALAEQVGALCQLVVICGRNQRLQQRLQQRQWPEGMRVTVKGFVNNMAEWMSACDTIITKAGPGTIAESFICGLPVLLNGYVPCQEYGNVPFVVDNKVGAFERDPVKAAQIVYHWFTDQRAEFDAMAARARQIGRPWASALLRIVADLAALAE